MKRFFLNRLALSAAGAVGVFMLAMPAMSASAAIIADWRFARTASSVTPVTDGQAVTAGELYDEVVGGGAGAAHTGDTFESPKYATYNPTELAGFAGGGDGYALHTGGDGVGLGYVYFLGDTDLATNDIFSVWSRVKWESNLGGVQFVFDRPNNWDVRLDAAGTLGKGFAGSDQYSGFTWTPGDWHDVGVVYSGGAAGGTGVVEMFVDGVSQGTFDSGALSSFDVFHIGAGPSGGFDFNGLYDRVIFWDEAVSAQVMADLSSVPEPGSLALAGLGLFGLASWGLSRRFG